ncbi:MAG: hypothetical protein JXQ73_24275 [Phycisphaerae bacterium]|nr:hypothetical protein [Phycisphaerae bacterium]
MAEDVKALLDHVCDTIAERANPARIATAKRRHADMLAGRASDYIPMLFGRPASLSFELQSYDWKERFHDPDKSLYCQLKDNVLPQVSGDGDNVPGVRADMGVVNGMSIYGAGYDVPEHTKPVVNRYVSKGDLAAFEVPEDISDLGTMPRVREHMEHHLAVLREHGLGDVVRVVHCDQQGPFDISAQSRGHDIFIDLYEDPDFVHDLMAKSTQIYIAISKLCKRINGEPDDSGLAVDYWIENGGVRMCGDSDILMSAELYRELVQPYVKRALAAFGGGWYHYCGGARGYKRAEGLHLHEIYGEIEPLRGLNWTTAGDWLGEMRKLRSLGVTHLGSLPREEGESLDDYFRRALSPYDDRRGMIFWPELHDGEHETAPKIWHRIQDAVFA